MPATPRHLRTRQPRGLTLVEVLVTLVIVSAVALIVAQALQQLARVERLLEAGQLRNVADSVRGAWVRVALEALMPGATEAERLRGSERELQGLSSEVPMPGAPGLGLLHLRLATGADAAGGSPEMRLELLPASAGGAKAAPVTLLRWPGREGRFRFLDEQGEWQDRWPPLDTRNIVAPAAGITVPMPHAVLIETGLDSPRLIVAALPVTAVPQRTRKQSEAM